MCAHTCPHICLYGHHIRAQAQGVQKRISDPLKQELQALVNHQVESGNQIRVL